MLGDKDAVANIVVKNLKTAKKFYGETLGLTQIGAEGQEVIIFRSGSSTIYVYKSQYTGTNQATRSEEHTSELQSRQYLVCRLLLEKKKGSRWKASRTPGLLHMASASTP